MRKRYLPGLLSLLATPVVAQDDIGALTEYAQEVVSSVQEGALTLEDVRETTSNNYLVVFSSDDPSLQSQPNAAEDRQAYLMNRALTESWSAAFCTDALKSLIEQQGIGLVTGQLQNPEGERQSMSPCM